MANENQTSTVHGTSERDDRVKKLEEIKKLGMNPYPDKTSRTHSIIDALASFDDLLSAKETVVVDGRIMIKREFGNLTFAELYDGTGKIQLAFSKKDIGPEEFKKFSKLIDMGDFIEAAGTCFITHKGEKSLMVSNWKILTKAILPLPEKWHGLKDEEERLRLRYLDILLNPETKELFIKKSKFWNAVREFLVEKGFVEVETPVLETTTGGADARPFITHHNALDMDVYLRISTGELWQKRLMVAGFEKTFEIGRQFRNEGMDAEHLQDYTQMELYWAYANHEDGMQLVEELYRRVAEKVFGTLKFKIRGFDVDLGKTWQRYDYQETVKKYTGIDILNSSENEIKAKLQELKVEFDEKGFNVTRAIDNLWKFCRKQIAGPGFLVGVPKVVSPLAKADPLRPELTERFQPIIAGSELGNGYSELNDPLDQAQRFAAQQKLREAGDEEAQMFDHEFVEALEHGMPPTCGFGMSERVFAFLADKSARECQLFPLLRPKKLSANPEEEINITG
jgi:lysyl-tRNA synthetase, class II